MKKYLALTSREAIQHFIHQDDTLIPETYKEIKQKIDDLNGMKGLLCITITLPTQRTAPDTKYDTLNLKNLITKTEEVLQTILDKREILPYLENIKEAQEFVDHSHNLEGMAIYANEYFSSIVKLPIHLNEGIIIGQHFDIRPLIKTEQQNEHYYIITVSRQKIRLFEVLSNKLEFEIENEDFPYLNTHFYTTDPIKLRQDVFMDNLTKEFFNVADKRLRNYRLVNPFPLILMGDIKSVAHFQEIMDDASPVISIIDGNYDNTPLYEIMKVVNPVIDKYREEKQNSYISEINTAISKDLLVTDLDMIYTESLEGNADTLFMGANYSLRGSVQEDEHLKITDNAPNDIVITDDLTLKLIKNVYAQSGKVIFMDDDLLKKYNGLVLIKRFNVNG